MKTLPLPIIVILFTCVIFLITPYDAYANSCADKLTSYTTPQFFLLSDTIFSGTVLHIDNTTDHQWKVFFTVDKMWKGSPSEKPLTVTTNTLQGCGYSITYGEKYLAYASGYPSNLNVLWTKSYADAQNDIALLDDPKFQAQAVADEELYKKLTTAKDMLSHTASNQSLPIFMSDVDEMTLTLVVGIDDTKTPLLSADGYQKMVKNIVGNIPVKIVFGHNEPLGYDISGLSLLPLKQFKSGINAEDVKCNLGLWLVTKAEDGSPACVKSDTVQKLMEKGWAKGPRGVSALANPPVSLFNVTTSPQPIILGEPFVIKATVVNHESVPITFYDGCAFPLSASFDDSIMTYPYSTMHCLAMSKNVIEPNGTAVIYSDKMGTRHNSSGTGVTSAMLTFRYESDEKQASFTMSKQFMTSPAQTLQERWVQNKHGASPCSMPYHPQNAGMPVLFMPTNSIGKVCVNYSNGNDPTTVTPRVFGAQNLSHDTQDISVSPLQANVVHGNSTIVYTITSGDKAGFYGLTIFCYGTPIAVGYDNQSRIVTGDFPWLHQTFYCPLQSYNYHIVGVGGGMGIKYVPP